MIRISSRRARIAAILAAVLFVSSIAAIVAAVNPTFSTIMQPGSMAAGFRYTVFTDGASLFYRDGQTGGVTAAASTDAGSFFTSLIATASTNQAGVYVQQGTYSFTTAATGNFKTVNIQLEPGAVLKATAAIDSLFFFQHFKGMITGGTFNANSQANYGIDLVSYDSGSLTIQNGEYENALFYGMRLAFYNANSVNLTVSNNNVHNNVHDGIVVTSAVNNAVFSGVSVVGNRAWANGAGGAQDVGIRISQSSDTVVANNLVYQNNLHGILIGSSHNATVTGNVANNNKGVGIYVDFSDNVTVVGNVANNNPSFGIDYTSGNRGGLVADNIALYDGTGIWMDVANSRVVNNNVCGSTTPIGLSGGSHNVNRFYVGGNTCYNPVGKVTNFVEGVAFTFGPVGGSSSGVVASKIYNITYADQYITSTGGTGVSITIYDANLNVLASGLTTLTAQFFTVGMRVGFGAFSVAPTVTDVCN